MFPPWRLVVKLPAETALDVQGVVWVQVQLADGGPITILPGHAPLVAETVTAPLRYKDGSGAHSLVPEAGVLYVSRGEVAIYTTAVPADGESGGDA